FTTAFVLYIYRHPVSRSKMMSSESATPPAERLQSLSAVGASVQIKKDISPIKYFRSGIQMEKVARAYAKEGDLERAYKILHRFITLFIEKLPKHPLYKKAEASRMKEYSKKIHGALDLASDIKQRLSDQYATEYQSFLERQKRNEIAKLAEAQSKLEECKDYNLKSVTMDPVTDDSQSALMVIEEQHPEDSMSDYCKPKQNYESSSSIDSSNYILEQRKPSVDRSLKPATNINEIVSPTLDGLRCVKIPERLPEYFLAVVQKNTASNIETCGILSGHLMKEVFQVTHVIIPKQHGTADSCTTEEEEEIFDYQDSRDLVTLGWIHTHPSQTSFLSSVDLHTQYSYQIMMPEAIAIVCAPRYNQTGYFTLTRDDGLDIIGNCKEVGFHPHPSHPILFEECKHICLDSTHEVQLVDLRST
ncbi:STAM-binding protein-like A, partial [Trichoplax sp. H2]